MWYIQIHVLPGTHHFKFIVDDQWKIAEEYPTAVDDIDGSLANYVNVTGHSTVSPSSSSPQPTPQPHQLNQFASFWSDASSSTRDHGGPKEDSAWTTVIPQELVNAAQEEEHYLASQDSPTTSSSVPAPNIPPAPVLPRHLDKLILNARPQIAGSAGSPSERDRSRREKEREKEKDRARRRERDREGKPRAHAPSSLGMTSTATDGKANSPPMALPVTTASGAEVAATSIPPTPAEEGGAQLVGHTPSKRLANATKLDAPGMADDGSVLPVPSHVVLHHLSTSAIRNGVLAVANTTRYRKKVSRAYVFWDIQGLTAFTVHNDHLLQAYMTLLYRVPHDHRVVSQRSPTVHCSDLFIPRSSGPFAHFHYASCIQHP